MTNETFDLDQLNFFSRSEGLKIEDVCDDLSLLRFVDLESSGIGKMSYPIEYGSCGLDLMSSSFLIRRRPDFSLGDWSASSQNLHKITLEELERFGVDAVEAVTRIAHDLAPSFIGLSDNPAHDSQWLTRLSADFESLDLYPVDLFLRQARIAALDRHGYERLSRATLQVQQTYPHVHRAGPDSLRAAAQFRLLVDDEYLGAILGS
jgi:hypothetical protein